MADMRVGILTPGLRGGGAEAVAREWIQQLPAVGVEPVLITYDDPWTPLPDVEHFHLMDHNAGPRVARLARRLAATERVCDVIVGVLTYSNLLAMVARLAWGL